MQLRLDEIRAKMPKFVCLNDDMNKTSEPPAATLRALRDFYHSYFPAPCPFENEPNKPNDFEYIQQWRERKKGTWQAFKEKIMPTPAPAAATTKATTTTTQLLQQRSEGGVDLTAAIAASEGVLPRWILWLWLLVAAGTLVWFVLTRPSCWIRCRRWTGLKRAHPRSS